VAHLFWFHVPLLALADLRAEFPAGGLGRLLDGASQRSDLATRVEQQRSTVVQVEVVRAELHGEVLVERPLLPGPQLRVPVIGVPSASGAPERRDEPAGYNLYEIEGAWGAWRCTMVSRSWRGGGFVEINRQPLFA